MNFFKGTGIAGLHGILPKQGKITRPLLFARKEDIIDFAEKNKLAFVEDSTNETDKYTRNYFRNQIIPGLLKIFPKVEENLKDNINRFNEIEILYKQAIDLHKKKLLVFIGNETHIPVLKLMKLDPVNTIIYEIIQDYGFTPHQTEEVIGLFKSGSGKYIQSASHRIIKNRNWLIISPKNNNKAVNILIEANEAEIIYEQGKISIKQITPENYNTQTSNLAAQLNADEIQFPLLLRKWKTGDYFYPLGMKKKKKLSRFFIDQKLAITQKEKTWVIEMDKKILWVVGLRIDDRFKVTENTKQVLKLTLTVTE